MNIAFFEIKDWERNDIERKLDNHLLHFYPWPLSEENASMANNCEIISVFIYSKINKKVLDKLPKLKLIVTRSTGYDHIDIEECRKRKIILCNIPNYGENTVAEHTFALMLDLSRKIHKAFVRTVRDDFSIEGLKGFDLKGKTLGVVGTGRIGRHVIKIARGFEMKVIAYDVKKDSAFAKQFRFKYVALEELLKNSDIITLHVPLNEKTFHLINKNSIKIIKKGAILINTSRGEVIETSALLHAINSDRIAGAGLDVIEGEEIIKEEKQILHNMHHLRSKKMKKIIEEHLLLHNDKVIFTPHMAFYSQEALERIISATLSNIIAFLKKKPQNIVK